MPSSKEELKVKLLADAEAALTAMLQDARVNEEMTLSEMEVVVGKLGDQLLQRVMQRLVEQSQEKESNSTCQECRGSYVTRAKETSGWSRCEGQWRWNASIMGAALVGQPFFPVVQKWNLNQTIYRASAAQQMVWLSGLLPYGSGHLQSQRRKKGSQL